MIDKKALGWIILIIAFLFIDIIPGPTDIIPLKAYSMYSGVDITLDNLSSIYLDYFIWSLIIGLILLFIALNLLGWDLKRLFKKLDITKYKTAILLALGVVVLVAFLDVQGMIYWASFSSAEAYTLGQQGPAFWGFFKSIAFSFLFPVFIIIANNIC